MRIEEVVANRKIGRVFLDMDGVLADFFGEWARLDGKDHYKDIDNPQAKLNLVRQHPSFWVNLPKLPHADILINHVMKLFGEYYICSKPLEGDPRSQPGKYAWIKMHLQNAPPAGVILTHNKSMFATDNGLVNILVDDYGINVNSWQMAGGIGIKYEDKNYTHALQELSYIAEMIK